MKLRLKSWPKWRITLALAASVASLGWLALPLWRSVAPEADTNVPQPSAAPQASAPPAPARSRAPVAAPSAAAPAQDITASVALAGDPWQALASDEPGTRIEALRALGERRDPAALSRLLELDPAHDAETAPTLIQVVAKLAEQADATQRSAAALQLGRWLRSEMQREDDAARGNRAVLLEALASLDSREAVVALIDALDTGRLPTHLATLAVEGLGQRGDASAEQAIARFRQRLGEPPEAAGFERELHDEAVRAAEHALARLAR